MSTVEDDLSNIESIFQRIKEKHRNIDFADISQYFGNLDLLGRLGSQFNSEYRQNLFSDSQAERFNRIRGDFLLISSMVHGYAHWNEYIKD